MREGSNESSTVFSKGGSEFGICTSIPIPEVEVVRHKCGVLSILQVNLSLKFRETVVPITEIHNIERKIFGF